MDNRCLNGFQVCYSHSKSTNFSNMIELLTVKELAQYLKLNPATIMRMTSRGEMPAIKLGRQLRFDKEQINRWLTLHTTGKPVQILIVDDDESITRLFCNALKGPVYNVSIAYSARQAMDFLQECDFDLVFLDLVMPGMNGSELFKHIRQMKRNIPVAIMTGYPDSNMFRQAMEYGPFLVINKPFSIEDIFTAIHCYTKQHPGGEASPA